MWTLLICMSVLAVGPELATTVAPTQGIDCMTQLIDLAVVISDNRNRTISIFHDQELDQALFYDMSRFRDVGDLLKLAGIKTLKDQFSLFKCLSRASSPDSPCFLNSPCGHGICTFQEGRYQCSCNPGYTGSECRQEMNECDLRQPCLNGATCHDHVNNYTCDCAPGFYGRQCETDRNECASSPCVNGKCIDVVNGYRCECQSGYTGTVCDEDLDECASSPCKPHGRCHDHFNKYSCQCHAGYKGYNCDVDIDECASQPCLNQATCVDNVNNFTCQCPLGYDGRHCENLWLSRSVLDDIQKTQRDTQAYQQRTQSSLEETQMSLKQTQSSLEGSQTKISSLVSSVSSAYTRWGRTTCPDSATLVYTGYVAGPHYTHAGGVSNPLCLHQSPKYARYADYTWGGVYYGAVYKMQGQSAPYPSSQDSKLAPCVVCTAERKSTTVMIPARNDCPTGWSLEYHGYLLSSHYSTDKKSQSLCFDDNIEGLSPTGTGGHHLYRVGVDVGYGLPSSFPNARELTCAVCSK